MTISEVKNKIEGEIIRDLRKRFPDDIAGTRKIWNRDSFVEMQWMNYVNVSIIHEKQHFTLICTRIFRNSLHELFIKMGQGRMVKVKGWFVLMEENKNILLSLRGITMVYPGTVALKKVNADFYKGEIVALVGENGAGKSTLIKIISGLIEPTEGEIILNGKTIHLSSPNVAFEVGISALQQELNLAGNLNVTQNIFLGNEKKRWKLIPNISEMKEIAMNYLKLFDVDFSPSKPVNTLSSVQREIVQICQALVHDSQFILFDEPTAAMEEMDVKKLFEIIKNLKSNGKTILYVSHKLSEVIEIADRAIVLKDGMKVGELKKSEFDINRIVKLMAGRDVEIMKKYLNGMPDSKCKSVLKVEHLTTESVKDVSFELKQGEILGFAGLIGSGRSETMRAILGLDPTKKRGKVYLHGEEVVINNPYDAIKKGIVYLPEERKTLGIFPTLSVEENMSISSIRNESYFGIIPNKSKIRKLAESYKEALKANIPSFSSSMNTLSGGNQQKVMLARCLLTNPDILILDEPTRGVDVETKSEIYELMKNIVKEGRSIIMISSELDEVVNMSDRIIIMHEGNIVKILENKSGSISKEDVVALMSGLEEVKL
ncbi:MAG: sugar ABC transporter ATP-binding protein [Conexivisphaerales archaeon]